MVKNSQFALPDFLDGNEAQGLRLQSDQSIAQFEIGNYRNFVYLILDWKEKKAAIIDPQSDLSAPLEVLAHNGFVLTSILLTHTHHDHIAGVPGLLELLPTLPVYVHEDDAHRLKKTVPTSNLRGLQDSATIKIGSLVARLLHTPGHSAGEVCYSVDTSDSKYLFTGDTIFVRDCGRTDLESGSNSAMFDSLQRIRKLPADTIILPGHHYKPECNTVLGRELIESPPFQCKTEAELRALP